MPTPNNESLANANFIQAGQGALATHMNGRTTGLPVYELDYNQLELRVPAIGPIVRSAPADARSMANAACVNRRANHNDALGNLPFGPSPNHALCEYHVPANGLPYPAHLRLVYDTYRRMLYITPTHYDPWNDNTGAAHNPFYLVLNTPYMTFGGRA